MSNLALPGSSRSGEKPRKKSVPARSPPPSRIGFTTINGEYFVIAENGYCHSDSSDVVQFTLTGIQQEETASLNVKVFPNPCNDKLHIKISAPTDISCMINLFNANGQIVLSQQAGAGTDLFLHDLPSGLYILTVKSSIGVYRERIVKF